jgi:hypothetical protein
MILMPDGPNHTIEHVEVYYAQDLATKPDFANIRANNTTMRRDVLLKMCLLLKVCRKEVILTNVMAAYYRL